MTTVQFFSDFNDYLTFDPAVLAYCNSPYRVFSLILTGGVDTSSIFTIDAGSGRL